jgi:hypothetical protein
MYKICVVVEPFVMRGKSFKYAEEIVVDKEDWKKLSKKKLIEEIDF